ncbi:hypothetical protein CAL7716_037820 [Calothrix sp. PCC 7716]|nr:hypothetical protein CAL7716_037820 [Calothrix sp. PCC 7716]
MVIKKKSVIGAKLNNNTLITDTAVRTRAKCWGNERLEPNMMLEKYRVGKHINSVIRYNAGSLTADDIACIQL